MAETDYPILVFPEPAHAERARRFGGGGKTNVPPAAHQAQRLAPQFERLQRAMDRQSLAIQGNPFGIQPEQVLVLETIGAIHDFVRAVRKISGLEWLGELEIDDIVPDYGFEDAENADKRLKGQLFLVMTDQRALGQMRRLFELWRKDPTAAFPRGLAPLKEAFRHLRIIRPWEIEDRIRETGILEDWRDRLEHGQDEVPFEAELWFRGDVAGRELAESRLRRIIEAGEGQVVQQCIIPDIRYHAILGRLPRPHVQALMADRSAFRGIELLQCEQLMYARPVGQCAFPASDGSETEPLSDGELTRLVPPARQREVYPTVALLDGMPLTGHRVLGNRVTVDDPDGYESAYQAHERVHGTSMASVICHGDLNQLSSAPVSGVYARPILQPRRGFDGEFVEAIPESVLPVDLIHRAVRRLFEGENGEPPVAPSVRIINLSVGDSRRPLGREMSAWARLLDWLAWKYGVLFVVSAGNHLHDLELDVRRSELAGLSVDGREQAVIAALATDTRNRRLLSPAETMNGLTVGAVHGDATTGWSFTQTRIDPFAQPGVPSMVSAHGPGYRRAIKPDVFVPGGRQLVREKMGTGHENATLQLDRSSSAPGQRVATPGPAGQLDRTRYARGTSGAAALMSHCSDGVYRILEGIRGGPGRELVREYYVVLTKALLAHASSWAGAGERYGAALRNGQNGRAFREYLGRFLGYGLVDIEKIGNCTEQRVTVLGFGKLDDGDGDDFAFPVPPSLSAVAERRRLTVTLAWLSPINAARQGYRVAHLWFDPKNEIAPNRQFADHRAVQRGTLQHEVLVGEEATVFGDGDFIKLRVNCRADAGEVPGPIRYGLAMTLEVAEGIDIPIWVRLFCVDGPERADGFWQPAWQELLDPSKRG